MTPVRAPISGLIFDKDGTLFDFGGTWDSWAVTVIDDLAQGRAAARRAIADALGYDLDQLSFRRDSPVIAGTLEEAARLLAPHVEHIEQRALVEYLDQSAARAPLAPAVPLGPCLDALAARGLALGVVTNDSARAAGSHLQTAGIRDRFAFVAGYDSGFGAKPDPGPLLACAGALELPPAHCAMVGDSTHDLLAGRAAGMHTIAVLTGPARARDLAPLADVVLADIGRIGAWLDRTEPG